MFAAWGWNVDNVGTAENQLVLDLLKHEKSVLWVYIAIVKKVNETVNKAVNTICIYIFTFKAFGSIPWLSSVLKIKWMKVRKNWLAEWKLY